MSTSVLALLIAFMSGNNFEYVVASMSASSIAVYSVRDIKNRSQFFLTTPALVFISFGIILLGFALNRPNAWDGFGSQILARCRWSRFHLAHLPVDSAVRKALQSHHRGIAAGAQ